MSIEKKFQTGETPHLIIEQMHGNLVLRTWEEQSISVSGTSDAYRFHQEGDEITLTNIEDARVLVPSGASVTLGDVHGNVHVAGPRGQLKIHQVHGNLRADEVGECHISKVGGDFALRDVEGSLTVGVVGGNFSVADVRGDMQMEQCSGNCTARDIAGAVTLDKVRGNLNLHNIDRATVGKVHGNLAANDVHGDLQVEKVGGNVTVTDIQGNLEIERVGGDLRVREITGALNATVGGNATLNLFELATPQVVVDAGGDIRCRVPVALQAEVALQAGGVLLIKNLPVSIPSGTRQAEFTVGHGEGRLELTAGSNLYLIASDSDEMGDMYFEFQGHQEFAERASEFAQQLAEQVEVQVEVMTRQLNERLAQLDNSDVIAAKVQEKVQSAMRRAEEKIAEAMRRAERQSERQAERQAMREERRGVRFTSPIPRVPPVPPVPPTPPKPKRNPVSAEERMLILRMLEEGKISVEQAEKLIAAMGE